MILIGYVPPSCTLDISKVKVLTVENVKKELRCNTPVKIRIDGLKVYVEAL